MMPEPLPTAMRASDSKQTHAFAPAEAKRHFKKAGSFFKSNRYREGMTPEPLPTAMRASYSKQTLAFAPAEAKRRL